MAADVSPRLLSPSADGDIAPPEDLAGVRFLRSVGWAVLAGAWGAWLGSMVESAVFHSAESRIGAVIAAAALAACGAVAAYLGAARHGAAEAAGRALTDGVGFAWQGAWLGGLVGGGLTAANGGRVMLLVSGAVFVGGLIGFLVGRRLFRKDTYKVLRGAIWGGLMAGFGASLLLAPSTANVVPSAVAAAPSPVFGPGTDWVWRGGAAVPLVVAAFVWWVRWMREERAKGPEAAGWGMGVAAFLFVAAMAVGAGAIVGGLAQLGCGYVAAHFTLTATSGTWLGALVALFFWGLGQQPKRLAAPAP